MRHIGGRALSVAMLWIGAVLLVTQVSTVWAQAAEQLFAEHCAVCHGADRGGYIAPALNKDSLKRLATGQIVAKVKTGGVGTLMPPHPTFFGKLSSKQVSKLAEFIKTTPKKRVRWNLEDIRGSLQVYIPDEASLPSLPIYSIGDMDDLMAVAGRGRYAAGDEAKVIFFDGQGNRKLGEIPTQYAPHIVDYHPKEERFAYVTTDAGYLFKIDLYSFRIVRRVRVGLNGASLAVSRDGRFLAAGSYVPNTAVILDATTLEPLKLFELKGVDPDGKMVESDSGVILSTPFLNAFVMALEQSGQVWVVDLGKPDFPVKKIKNVGRHLHDAFLSPSGRYLAMASYDDNVIVAIDLKEMKVLKRMPAGRQPHVGSGAIIRVDGRTLGIGTNIGTPVTGEYFVTVFDMESFEVVKQIPVLGPTESPAAHPKAPYIVVDIVGTSAKAAKIQFIDKRTLEVVKTITVGGHSHFPEYTARGDYLYVSAGYGGDKVVVYRSDTLKKIKSFSVEVPAGIFSHLRSGAVAIGLERLVE